MENKRNDKNSKFKINEGISMREKRTNDRYDPIHEDSNPRKYFHDIEIEHADSNGAHALIFDKWKEGWKSFPLD